MKAREEAEDAVQEVFIRLWKMGDQLDSYQSIDALATTMTRNYCIDQIRKKKNLLFDYKEKDSNKLITASPLELLENKESDEIIESMIENLPETFRGLIQMRDVQGLDYEEIAGRTGQNINTIRVTISRARALLRDEYKKYYNEKRGTKRAAGKIL
jgi:RNA polymerase sigma-70 factor (ECF subfamily)